ncbi:MAG: oligoendopeptidase F family protein, partial [bacterium]|nr:oligoendopeptidase F family protein [bacterium]
MTYKAFITLVIVLAVIFLPALNSTAQERSQNRDEIPAKYKWNFSDIYPDWQQWEKGLAEMGKKMDAIAALKGTLAKGPEHLLNVLKLQDELGILAFRVYRYPQLQRDTDTRNQDLSSRLQQVQIRFAKFGVATSWINPELLTIPWETMKKWLDTTPALAIYRFGLEDLYRQQSHVLDADKETLLAYGNQLQGTPTD